VAQAARGRRNGARRKFVSEALVRQRTDKRVEKEIRSGIVPGAEDTAEQCPVCGFPSEGWLILPGKKIWHHFRRQIPCVERLNHVDPKV
jgi:hypothetical protein